MENNKGSIILYQTADGTSNIEVTLANDTVWLTTDQMAELFQRNKSTISRHIKNVFEEGELDKEVVVAEFATTTQHGAKQKANTEYAKFKERSLEYLSPVEIHFLESFEKERKRLKKK